MSFVPVPQQANAASSSNITSNALSTTAAAPAAAEISDHELVFKIRTFDVYWVDKTALMYKDGYAKVSCPRQVGV